MLKMSPSARLRVGTSSISVSLFADHLDRTTSSTGAPLSSTIDMRAGHARALVDDVLAEAAQAVTRADQADSCERLLDGVFGHAQRVGDGQPAHVVLHAAHTAAA